MKGVGRQGWRVLLVVVTLLLLGLLIGRLLRPGPLPRTVLAPDPDCDLRAGPCALAVPGGGRIRFGILPREIPVGKELKLEVWLEGLEAKAVTVDIDGVDMAMGLSPYPLRRDGPGHFSGPGGLNFCSRGIMEWEARVIVRQEGREIVAPFRFITQAPDPARPLAAGGAGGGTR